MASSRVDLLVARPHVDLAGACATFVAAVGRTVPALRGHTFTVDQVHDGLALGNL